MSKQKEMYDDAPCAGCRARCRGAASSSIRGAAAPCPPPPLRSSRLRAPPPPRGAPRRTPRRTPRCTAHLSTERAQRPPPPPSPPPSSLQSTVGAPWGSSASPSPPRQRRRLRPLPLPRHHPLSWHRRRRFSTAPGHLRWHHRPPPRRWSCDRPQGTIGGDVPRYACGGQPRGRAPCRLHRPARRACARASSPARTAPRCRASTRTARGRAARGTTEMICARTCAHFLRRRPSPPPPSSPSWKVSRACS